MITKVVVHETPQEFSQWLADASKWQDKLSYPQRGAQLYAQRGCNSCHSVDGTANTGPTWKNLWGKSHAMADGSNVTVDEDYIRESIFYPGRKIVAGYSNQMPSYLGQLAEDDVLALIWYIKSLTDNFDKTLLPTAPPMATEGAAQPATPASPGN